MNIDKEILSKKLIERNSFWSVKINQEIPDGDYYHKLNKLLAWMYFDIKKPDQYIKTTISKHIKRLA